MAENKKVNKTTNERLQKVLKGIMSRFDLQSQLQIAEIIGTKNTYLSDVLNERYPISEKLSEKFRDKFGVNPDYLLKGKGTIWLDGSVTQLGDNNIAGNNNSVGSPTTLEMALQSLVKSQEQIDRLITIIEKMQSK